MLDHKRYFRLSRVNEGQDDELATIDESDVVKLAGLFRIKRFVEDGVKQVLCYERGCAFASYRLVNGKNPRQYRLQRPPKLGGGSPDEDLEEYSSHFMDVVRQVRS